MNTAGIEQEGIKTRQDFKNPVAEFHRMGMDALFVADAGGNRISSSLNSYYKCITSRPADTKNIFE